jgi:hypothetical protein
MVLPKKIFLIDGAGALLTALTLIFAPVLLPGIFGLPQANTLLLGSIAVCFAVYSLYNYVRFNPTRWKLLLRIIALANLAYCLLSLVMILYFYKQVTVIGWIYFTGEITIIIALFLWEMKILNRNNLE